MNRNIFWWVIVLQNSKPWMWKWAFRIVAGLVLLFCYQQMGLAFAICIGILETLLFVAIHFITKGMYAFDRWLKKRKYSNHGGIR